MWPDTEDKISTLISNMKAKALVYNRTVQFGLRVHVIVRETEAEARKYASKLISNLDYNLGNEIKDRAQDSKSLEFRCNLN